MSEQLKKVKNLVELRQKARLGGSNSTAATTSAWRRNNF